MSITVPDLTDLYFCLSLSISTISTPTPLCYITYIYFLSIFYLNIHVYINIYVFIYLFKYIHINIYHTYVDIYVIYTTYKYICWYICWHMCGIYITHMWHISIYYTYVNREGIHGLNTYEVRNFILLHHKVYWIRVRDIQNLVEI